MALTDLDDKVLELITNVNRETFIYDFLIVMGMPKATVTRAQNGGRLNLAKRKNDLHIKNKIYYREASNVFEAFSNVEHEISGLKNYPRFIIVTNFDTFVAKDNKTNDSLNIKFIELPKYNSFFLPLQGIEKVDYDKENPADIKAAERFAKIYDVLKRENKGIADDKFNTFLIRLLFMLFAEDTNIMPRAIFTNAVKTMTAEDGSDMNLVVKSIFDLLDNKNREGLDNWLKEFPYVNGQLFTEPHEKINFSKTSRRLIIEAGERLDWTEINPDIFGSMVQTVATEDSRSHLGMHYTSVTNIMKVIKPLFLDELYNSFHAIIKLTDRIEESKRLDLLHERLTRIKFFDPASGSGNFLIITYKEIRRLEIKILREKINLIEKSDLREINKKKKIQEIISTITNDDLLSEYKTVNVNLGQFFGIEIDPFAHEVSRLSLWIAEHQMNVEMQQIIPGAVRPTLPLHKVGDIRLGNALKIDWSSIVENKRDDEVYVFGNPPYKGANKQGLSEKKDVKNVFLGTGIKTGELDYITCWFILGARFISESNSKVAFVTTNSIIQGKQVGMLWPLIYQRSIDIEFAYTSFKWTNFAKNVAGVTVVIIGLSNKSNVQKKIFFRDSKVVNVDNISAYLTDSGNVIVYDTKTGLNELPKMVSGNRAVDGGGLILTQEDYDKVSSNNVKLLHYIKKYVGAEEYINGNTRYVLWLTGHDYKNLGTDDFIRERIQIVRNSRLNSKDAATRKLGLEPWRFRETRMTKTNSIIIPNVSSENRDYVPLGMVGSDVIISNAASVIYDAPVWLLGLLESRMHMTWLRAVGGRLKTDYRYSAGLVYNTFPVPELSTQRKNEMKMVVMDILDYRDESGETLARLYNNKTMPSELRELHQKLDGIVDRAYRQAPFKDDQERLGLLLNMYQEMTDYE